MWYVYILKCADNTLYTGVATELSRRVERHNAGRGGACTRIRMPVTLAYSEECANRSAALKREAQIKKWTKEKKLALINGNISDLHNLSKSHD